MTDTDSRGYYYSRKCWYCGSFDMEDLGDHVKCRSCGATWNYIAALKEAPVTVVDAATGGPPLVGKATKYKPRVRRRTHAKVVED